MKPEERAGLKISLPGLKFPQRKFSGQDAGAVRHRKYKNHDRQMPPGILITEGEIC
jgi:hypothetical protein